MYQGIILATKKLHCTSKKKKNWYARLESLFDLFCRASIKYQGKNSEFSSCSDANTSSQESMILRTIGNLLLVQYGLLSQLLEHRNSTSLLELDAFPAEMIPFFCPPTLHRQKEDDAVSCATSQCSRSIRNHVIITSILILLSLSGLFILLWGRKLCAEWFVPWRWMPWRIYGPCWPWWRGFHLLWSYPSHGVMSNVFMHHQKKPKAPKPKEPPYKYGHMVLPADGSSQSPMTGV
jgi:hypothetical protein